MRTTIRLSDEIFKAAKQEAARSGRTLTAVIEDSLRQSLSRAATRPARAKVHLTTVGGRGPNPGVDLDDTAALLETMTGG